MPSNFWWVNFLKFLRCFSQIFKGVSPNCHYSIKNGVSNQCSCLVIFFQVIEDNSEDADNEYRKTVLVNFILNLFVPLSTLSQHPEIDKNKKNVEPASRQVCIRLMEMLQKINKNLWNDVIEFPNSLSRKKLCESGIDKAWLTIT